MIPRIFTLLFITTLASFAEVRRLEVMFLGDNGPQQPLETYRILKENLGSQGFNFTFVENLSEVTRETLDNYDALMVYANYQNVAPPPAIFSWVKEGGGLVSLSRSSANFSNSKQWAALLDSTPIDSIVDGVSWTRKEGKGRVYFSPVRNEAQVNSPEFREEMKRGILWVVGDKKAEDFAKLNLPPLTTEIPNVANRTHPDIPMMELQKPLSPQDSAAHTQVPVGTKLELFASEPMVINPIALDWDSKGRAWVVESFGYPNQVPDEPGTGMDNIKILEDSDSDGKADKMTVFASGLRHCTTSVFVKNGVVVTDGADIVYLGDENGDDKADTRKVLATGLGIHDTHASTSHFLYGLDNWIYATCGYSGVEVEIGGKMNKFPQSVFRFRPDLSAFELLQNTTNNTWGLGFTEKGDVIGSTANNNPSWILAIPNAAYVNSGIAQPKTPRLDTSVKVDRKQSKDPGASFVKMYANTRDITQVDQIAGYTAAAGHQFYNDSIMSATFTAQNAFICEPTGHIVATASLKNKGALMETTLRGNNAYASADAWAAPVAARVGPDGALWIADWYNPIIQHNVVFRYYNPARNYDKPHSPYQAGDKKGPGKGNAYETPLRDAKHGRIWRIVPKKSPLREITALDPQNSAAQVEALASPSQLIRLHAQRLLVEKGDLTVVPALVKLVKDSPKPPGSKLPLAAVHAIWTLEGLKVEAGSAGHQALTASLNSPDALIRRHALLALGAADPAVIRALPQLISTVKDPREQLFVMTQAAFAAPNPAIGAAVWKLASTAKNLDPQVQEAVQLALRHQGLAVFATGFADFRESAPMTWYDQEALQVITRLAAGPKREELVAFAPKAPKGLRHHIEKILAAPPVRDRVPVAVPNQYVVGRDAYMKACIECHQADGTGVAGTFPPLVNSAWVKGDNKTMIRLVLGGVMGPIQVNGQTYNGAMPGHSHMPDKELSDILNFVRFAFGNVKKPGISPADIKKERPLVEQRKFVPWSVADLQALEKK